MSLFIHTLSWQHQLQMLNEEIFDIDGIFDKSLLKSIALSVGESTFSSPLIWIVHILRSVIYTT